MCPHFCAAKVPSRQICRYFSASRYSSSQEFPDFSSAPASCSEALDALAFTWVESVTASRPRTAPLAAAPRGCRTKTQHQVFYHYYRVNGRTAIPPLSLHAQTINPAPLPISAENNFPAPNSLSLPCDILTVFPRPLPALIIP